MTTELPPPAPEASAELARALEPLRANSPLTRVDVFVRADFPEALRARVVSPEFSGVRPGARLEKIWPLLERAPELVAGRVTRIYAMAPEESSGTRARPAHAADAGNTAAEHREVGEERVWAIARQVPSGFYAFWKPSVPPDPANVDPATGVTEPDEDPADWGELLRNRDGDFLPSVFDTAESAREAAFAEARGRLVPASPKPPGRKARRIARPPSRAGSL